jgi:hypothetical protein
MKLDKLIYLAATGILTLVVISSSAFFLMNPTNATQFAAELGFPTFILAPIALFNIMAVIAIVTKKNKVVAEWAYAGLFFEFSIAIAAHIITGTSGVVFATIAIIALGASVLKSNTNLTKDYNDQVEVSIG